MRPPIAAALVALTLPLTAAAQPVLVRTDPPRATLVCDGRVVGITPVALDPARARTCTLFARGHANLAFDPAELTGVIASYHLEPVTPSPGIACGAIDPRTGLLRVCFDAAARPRRGPRPGNCGHLDPETGLMVVCFTEAPEPSRRPRGGSGCGRIDPRTGLLNVCLGEPAPAPPRRANERAPRGRACGHLDPATGLIQPCFD